MAKFKQYHLWMVTFMLISCSDSGTKDFAKKITFSEHLAVLSEGWEVNHSVNNTIVITCSNGNGLKTGESLFFNFEEPKYVDFIEFVDIEQDTFIYKIYLDNKYVGKARANQKIGVRKKVGSVRVTILKKGKELVVEGWDKNYNYTFVKDTLKAVSQSLSVKLSNEENVYIKKPVNNRKPGLLSKNKSHSFGFIEKQCVLYLKSKNKDEVVEQYVDFEENGSFVVSFAKVQNGNKELISEYFLHGNWWPVKFYKNRTEIRLKGTFLGSFDKKQEKEVFAYSNTVVIDSLNIIRSNDVLNGLMLDLPNWVMVNLRHFNDDFIIDIPYATTNNITGKKLYDCKECYLLYQTVKDLLKVQEIFKQKGFKLKLLDCYRPYDVQKILYDAFPVSGYVADPVGGSIHNRGTAVDLTLVDSFGNELDMGSEYDELSVRSNHGYIGFPDTVLQNRKLLRETMNACNFVTIRLEWWHYNHQFARKYPKLNDAFPCSEK